VAPATALQLLLGRLRAATEAVRRALEANDLDAFNAAMDAEDACFRELEPLLAQLGRPRAAGSAHDASRIAAISEARAILDIHHELGAMIEQARQLAALAVAGARRPPPERYERLVPGGALDLRG